MLFLHTWVLALPVLAGSTYAASGSKIGTSPIQCGILKSSMSPSDIKNALSYCSTILGITPVTSTSTSIAQAYKTLTVTVPTTTTTYITPPAITQSFTAVQTVTTTIIPQQYTTKTSTEYINLAGSTIAIMKRDQEFNEEQEEAVEEANVKVRKARVTKPAQFRTLSLADIHTACDCFASQLPITTTIGKKLTVTQTATRVLNPIITAKTTLPPVIVQVTAYPTVTVTTTPPGAITPITQYALATATECPPTEQTIYSCPLGLSADDGSLSSKSQLHCQLSTTADGYVGYCIYNSLTGNAVGSTLQDPDSNDGRPIYRPATYGNGANDDCNLTATWTCAAANQANFRPKSTARSKRDHFIRQRKV